MLMAPSVGKSLTPVRLWSKNPSLGKQAVGKCLTIDL
jgi:hypothetical protein